MKPWTRAAAVAATLLILLLAYLLAWPVPIDPEAWEAPAFDPAAWPGSGTLAGAERGSAPDGHGPEDVEVDAQGRVYAGLSDGRILRWETPDATPTVFAETEGRPLGLDWDADGNLVVADAWKGLLAIDPSGTIEVLATECGGTPLVFADDLEAAPDGTIWFSDATDGFRQPDWKLDLLENRPRGRLCAWDPTTRTAREVLGGLYFANGVAVDPTEQFVLVNETARYRVRKVWIAGAMAGSDEVLVDNLPGYPDGLSTGSNGVFWLAIASPRNPLLDRAADKPWLRKLIVRLPNFVQPAPERTARAIGIGADGRVVHDLFDPNGEGIYVVTSVQERAGHLYLGSLVDNAWARVPVPGNDQP
jgi:sugar lactone lactonase YvrE